MLEVARLSASYGPHRAVDDVALHVGRGETVAILGANGAGKTTLLKALAGLMPAGQGSAITFEGLPIRAADPHRIVEQGIALVPEGRGIFGDLTVRENLMLGAFPRRARAHEAATLDDVLTLFPRLAERLSQQVRTMSGGEQQMVAIGRALMSRPNLLMLDEPSLGLSPVMTGELFKGLAAIKARGMAILIVEQNARRCLKLADRAYLIANGRIVGEGLAADLANDPQVAAAYLGGAAVPANDDGADVAPPPIFSPSPLPSTGEAPVPAPAVRAAPAHPESSMKHVNLMIDAREMGAADGRTFDRLDPMTGEVATRAAAATVSDAVAAVDAAAAAFPAWSALGPNERRTKLNAAADLMQQRAEDFASAMMTETGSTKGWALFNVGLAAGMLREAGAMTTQITGDVIPTDKPHNLALAIRQPVGVILGIAPWNAPVILGVRAIAMPLACGNTVVFKASEQCPATHQLIGQVMRDAGLPAGVVNVVTNAPADAAKVVETLIAHRAVKRVNFTGSTHVGRIIAETAARYLKPALLELGGKAPLVILDDADLDEAVNAAAFGAFMNQGQICMSTERIVVDAKVADAFVEKFAAKAKSLPFGDPRSGNVVLGSMVSAEAAKRVKTLIDDASAKGASVAAGGSLEGTVMPATILDRVTPAMRIYGEESFGPVVTVVRVNGDEEAIRVANDTEYGLSAAVFSRDIGRALGVARRIDSGICHINAPTVHDEPQMPFGGVKASGYGRFGGKAGIDAFTELRWITIQTGPRHYPF
ncbi:salicylaldehyde dehydrogenase (modular protein) [Phreatobacter cathodiphilus]|uniref:Salicylaldehyde dehydrogenase (Modular protein) n=2 Tax=Phreatobacter cathodiphilus TaxID=1868589 RepID=A0A2S0N722_9HYPH|nr:salicylaldehyde dehydrogenase (modular protein) [Phreatobacter cathodiphilus]